ncbi:hypothetical protein BGI40_08145 [Snodgrassella communis]|jgi:hypothetical protein|uniref:Uncharacterized protein n=1 Tax=Snodgrassella communis TaxID=2946699 RepID=A0A066TJK8_9NEIS|nr:hypothetical protein [Snodgrassella communis]KDN13677.1 hypothetical protein SALWKB12_0532 [Snodgrassella communis]KDN13773.1 hypothetical protein SALWKB29_2195 [Snodgrassella communis]PIT08417.1 hypothetical protein BGI31_05465 [Snodgrassella communis]PIT12124.1 hypothetical protein BGI29_03645 [Snodgrassella communis]PIT29109.1 hypothetical protein BGI39_05160 [Snodgrassella communis]
MNLFEECKEALKEDFQIIEGKTLKKVSDILYQFPLVKGNIVWSDLKFKDFNNFNDILMLDNLENKKAYVIADDREIPVFKTNLFLIDKNIYDVLALSPKLFIFNNEMIIQPLFPSDTYRFAFKK